MWVSLFWGGPWKSGSTSKPNKRGFLKEGTHSHVVCPVGFKGVLSLVVSFQGVSPRKEGTLAFLVVSVEQYDGVSLMYLVVSSSTRAISLPQKDTYLTAIEWDL